MTSESQNIAARFFLACLRPGVVAEKLMYACIRRVSAPSPDVNKLKTRLYGSDDWGQKPDRKEECDAEGAGQGERFAEPDDRAGCAVHQ